LAGRQWLTPIILATQETGIGGIMVQNQLQANSSPDHIQKQTKKYKKGLAEWLKWQEHLFKHQCHPPRKRKKTGRIVILMEYRKKRLKCFISLSCLSGCPTYLIRIV
jgi:hypothetical protein